MIRHTMIVFVIFVILINLSAALKCYVCAGTSTSDCALGKKSSMGVQSCPNVSYSMTLSSHQNRTYDDDYFNDNEVDDRLQAVCLKFTAAISQPNVVIRECGVLPANVDPCDFLKKHASVKQCKSCTTDRCNVGIQDPVVDMLL